MESHITAFLSDAGSVQAAAPGLAQRIWEQQATFAAALAQAAHPLAHPHNSSHHVHNTTVSPLLHSTPCYRGCSSLTLQLP